MEALLISTLLVTLAEIGDKTQLLAFVLAARLRKPGAIIGGMFLATIANHAFAASLGVWLTGIITPDWLSWIMGGVFIACGLWVLLPDSLDGTPRMHPAGAFVTALFAFFIAEMGDKTQIATVSLAARFDALYAVLLGTTLGMMIANIPAVLLGEKLAQRLPLKTIRIVAAMAFIATGLLTLFAPAGMAA